MNQIDFVFYSIVLLNAQFMHIWYVNRAQCRYQSLMPELS